MKRIFLSFCLMGTAAAYAQVTTNGGSGLAANYPSLADAITALNAATISGPVVINLSAAQTAPAGGYVITAQGSAVNTITISGNSNVVTASAAHTAGSLTDGIIKLVGADYITLQNFNLQENAANTITAEGTNNMTEWGIAVLTGSATNGAQNNTIKDNTISLNKSYQNSFGVYSSTAHSSTDVLTLADISSAAGAHDNLTIDRNAIFNVNVAIATIGSPAFPGTGLRIGSQPNGGNTLTDWGTTAAYSAFARVDNRVNAVSAANFYAVVPGVLAVNQVAPTIAYNTITSNTAGNTDGVLMGIYVVANGTLAYPGSANTTDINYNTISLTSAVNAAASVPLISAIRISTGDANNTLNITHNNIAGIVHPANAAGNDTIVHTLASPLNLNMNHNVFTNLSFAHTGNAVLLGIHGRVFMPVNGTQNVNNNSISGTLTRTQTTGGSGLTVAVTKGLIASAVATDGSEAGSAFVAQNNNFSNISTNGGAFTAFVNFDGKVSLPTLTKTISNNVVSNVNTSVSTSAITTAGAINMIQFTSRGGAHTVSNNSFTNISAAATTSPAAAAGGVTGVFISSAVTGMTMVFSGNTLQDFAGGAVLGYNVTGVPATITNNKFIGFIGSTPSGTAGVAAITAGSILAGSTFTISGNKIGNLSNTPVGAGPSFNGTVAGINVSTGATTAFALKINNNIIGDLRAPNSTTFNAINGIMIGTGIITSEVAFNTVYLNASSTSATTFGTSCLLFTNTTSASLTLKSNILYNASTPAQNASNLAANGVVAALRLSAGSTGNRPAMYNTASNNNLFWANPTAGTNNHLSYVEGTTAATITNPKNTLADLQTFLATADAASVTEPTATSPFLSLVAADNNFLHINPVITSNASNAGMAVAGITTDFDGETRDASTPDIGADEYTATLLPVTLTSLSGIKSGTDNLLSWTTTTEVNNKGFDIQRSANGTNYVTIGFVASRALGGNSTGKNEYSFTDRNVAPGNFYYRLVQKDLDGRSKLSSVVMIADRANSTNALTAVYPNPVRSQLGIMVNATSNQTVNFVITDINGKVLKQMSRQLTPGSNSISVDVTNLPAGIYNLTLQMNGLNKRMTERFMKQ